MASLTRTRQCHVFSMGTHLNRLLGGGKLEVKSTPGATIIRVEPEYQRTPDTIIVLTFAEEAASKL